MTAVVAWMRGITLPTIATWYPTRFQCSLRILTVLLALAKAMYVTQTNAQFPLFVMSANCAFFNVNSETWSSHSCIWSYEKGPLPDAVIGAHLTDLVYVVLNQKREDTTWMSQGCPSIAVLVLCGISNVLVCLWLYCLDTGTLDVDRATPVNSSSRIGLGAWRVDIDARPKRREAGMTSLCVCVSVCLCAWLSVSEFLKDMQCRRANPVNCRREVPDCSAHCQNGRQQWQHDNSSQLTFRLSFRFCFRGRVQAAGARERDHLRWRQIEGRGQPCEVWSVKARL